MFKNLLSLAFLAVLCFQANTFAQEEPKQEDYYKIVPFTLPEGEVLEIGGLEMMPDGRLAVSTRRGEIWMVSNPYSKDPDKESKVTLFAQGLHEVLGLAYKDGYLYATQRCEITRIKDNDNDGRADVFETVSDQWEINGDYHEYAFGSPFDKDGNIWVTLCLTGSFSSQVKYRGWCVRVNANGKLTPTAGGIRSPGGMGMNHLGEVFYTDNQGPWNGTCGLKHIVAGSFQGHPGGNKWYDTEASKVAFKKKPEEPMSKSRFPVEAKKIPEYMPAAILFPYNKMGKSASGVTCDTSDGKFGPFKNQLFVGDQSYSTVMRVYLEKVDGRYQGACFPFLEGIGSGTLPLMMKNGSIFAGGTNRGWGSRGKKPFSLDRVDWTGKVPFEVHEMRAKPDGFELTFTEEVDPATVTNKESYELKTYTYIYQSSYGSPEVDHTTPTIESLTLGADKKSVYMKVKGLQQGHVHELHMKGVRSAKNIPLLHKEAYYTMNNIPKK